MEVSMHVTSQIPPGRAVLVNAVWTETVDLAISAADVRRPRIDAIVRCEDVVGTIVGTPAQEPKRPEIPEGWEPPAYIFVAPAQELVTEENITLVKR